MNEGRVKSAHDDYRVFQQPRLSADKYRLGRKNGGVLIYSQTMISIFKQSNVCLYCYTVEYVMVRKHKLR